MTAKEFWQEFVHCEEGLRFYLDSENKEKDHNSYSYLCAQLDAYCEGLQSILTSDKKQSNGRYTMTITCNGDKNIFLYVNRLVDEAPKIPHWEIRAFIEPKLYDDQKVMDEPFTFEDFSIKPKDILFTLLAWDPDENIFDLLLLLPLNLAHVEENQLEDAFMIIFQEIWGERFVADRINTLSFISHMTSEYDFVELEFLAEYLESFEDD